ncbi:CLUMA_CG009829, isoform A [Clunio marinus]|uniref:CLUMA_CG009829, isoform A n=1 Tax=Clunio marinus TaxID=568069 RepID=A0A1J1I808_9DIPT|nr:CLUMA_CG009829, isoform A [Clunio marinus]
MFVQSTFGKEKSIKNSTSYQPRKDLLKSLQCQWKNTNRLKELCAKIKLFTEILLRLVDLEGSSDIYKEKHQLKTTAASSSCYDVGRKPVIFGNHEIFERAALSTRFPIRTDITIKLLKLTKGPKISSMTEQFGFLLALYEWKFPKHKSKLFNFEYDLWKTNKKKRITQTHTQK